MEIHVLRHVSQIRAVHPSVCVVHHIALRGNVDERTVLCGHVSFVQHECPFRVIERRDIMEVHIGRGTLSSGSCSCYPESGIAFSVSFGRSRNVHAAFFLVRCHCPSFRKSPCGDALCILRMKIQYILFAGKQHMGRRSFRFFIQSECGGGWLRGRSIVFTAPRQHGCHKKC